MSPQEYYSIHSVVTDPGDTKEWFGMIEPDPEAIFSIVKGLVLPVDMVSQYVASFTDRDLQREINTLEVSQLVPIVLRMDERPISHFRPPEHRLIGICTHHAVLTCALLRHSGIPARVRHGFEMYMHPEQHEDHSICEYWNENSQQWTRIDTEMNPLLARERFQIDALDVSSAGFMSGAEVWLQCRKRKLNTNAFGIMGDGWEGGWEFVLSALLCDIHDLMQDEVLPWTDFQLSEKKYANLDREELDKLDQAVDLILRGDKAHTEFLNYCVGNPLFT